MAIGFSQLVSMALGARTSITAGEASEYIRGRNVDQLARMSREGAPSRMARFWWGFGGQSLRGQRSWQEVLVGTFGTSKYGGKYLPGWGGIRSPLQLHGAAHATQAFKTGLRPGAIMARAPSQFRRAFSVGFKGLSFALPLDIGLRVLTGEKAHTAVVRSAGGTLGGAVAAGVAGGIAGSVVPGLGNVVGFVGGVLGYMAGEAAADVGIAGAEYLARVGRQARRLELGGRVSAAATTRAAATMRARSLQQMNRSGIPARAIMGREAVLMHVR